MKPTGRTEAAGGKVAWKEKGASVKKSYKKRLKKGKSNKNEVRVE